MGNIKINLGTISKTSEGKIYKDLKMPLVDTFDANINANAIKGCIRNIFNWRRGQRILNPNFGNILYEYVYEPINEITMKNLRQDLIAMLGYEPRITVLSLDVIPEYDQNTITIKVKYLIPNLNTIESYSTTVSTIAR